MVVLKLPAVMAYTLSRASRLAVGPDNYSCIYDPYA